MPSPFDVLAGGRPGRSSLVECTVTRPAPAAFGDLLLVSPWWDQRIVWRITDWPASQGLALPQAGATCLVARSDRGTLRVTSWSGTYTPTGPAGSTQVGDLVPSAASNRLGSLLCDGTAYSRTTYAALFSAIGTAYGAGDGSTTFNVPDLRGRLPLGAGTGTADYATAWTLGDEPTTGPGGEQSHVQAESELAAHTHAAPSGSFYVQGGGEVMATGGTALLYEDPTTTSTGSSDPANILPPVTVVNWFIVYK